MSSESSCALTDGCKWTEGACKRVEICRPDESSRRRSHISCNDAVSGHVGSHRISCSGNNGEWAKTCQTSCHQARGCILPGALVEPVLLSIVPESAALAVSANGDLVETRYVLEQRGNVNAQEVVVRTKAIESYTKTQGLVALGGVALVGVLFAVFRPRRSIVVPEKLLG